MSGYKIEFSHHAKNDIAEMIDYLSQFYTNTALNKYDIIMESIGLLKDFPLMCGVYEKRPRYRKLVAEDYLIFYQVDEKKRTVRIYRVLYGRRDIRKILNL